MPRRKKSEEVVEEAVAETTEVEEKAVETEAAEAAQAVPAAAEPASETAPAEATTETADAAAEGVEQEAEEAEEPESNDSLTFSNGVIEKIVGIAVREVPGVLGMKGGFVNRLQETFGANVATKGVTVEIAPDNTMSVNIAVLMEYGAYAPQVFEDVKKVVVEQVSGMTGLEVGAVNLRIEDVLTAEEYKRLQREDAAEDEAE